jgi:hypothetical protein
MPHVETWRPAMAPMRRAVRRCKSDLRVKVGD